MRVAAKKRRGQGLVEYGLLIAGVALVCAAAVSIFGHKTNDLISALAVVLPGAHADDNTAIVSGQLLETTDTGNGQALDLDTISANNAAGTRSLGTQLGTSTTNGGFDQAGLITEP